MANALTKKEILKEIVKAGKDPVYFTTNYCRISHPQKGLIPFKAYDYQQELLKDFNDYRFNIIFPHIYLHIYHLAERGSYKKCGYK